MTRLRSNYPRVYSGRVWLYSGPPKTKTPRRFPFLLSQREEAVRPSGEFQRPSSFSNITMTGSASSCFCRFSGRPDTCVHFTSVCATSSQDLNISFVYLDNKISVRGSIQWCVFKSRKQRQVSHLEINRLISSQLQRSAVQGAKTLLDRTLNYHPAH